MRYLIAGGGTGGHIVPALNIARALIKFDIEAQFLFIGTEQGMEYKIVPDAGFDLKIVDAKPWNGISSLRNIFKSSGQVKRILKNFRCDAVIGTGGYVSAPAVIASKMARKPLFIQEQNTYPGLATKLGSVFAQRVFLGFEQAKKFLWRKSRAVITGNPAVLVIPNSDKESARRKFGLMQDYRTILLTGGSQGAASLNEAMKLIIEERKIPPNTQIIWQCGERGFSALEEWLAGRDLPIALRPFIEDMGTAYLAADMVISRAGALTLAEIAIAGLPAILIPYPYAAADHQRANAKFFANTGAATIIDQKDLSPSILSVAIAEILENSSLMQKMSNAAKYLAKPDAAKNIASEIIKTIESK